MCEMKDHNVVNTRQYFTDNYVRNLYSKIPSPLLTLNKTKTDFYNVQPMYSTKNSKEQRFNDGRNKTLFASIYLNECISFNVLGITKRKPGRFIGIDKYYTQSDSSDFDNKFLGQWFTTNIKHVFTPNTYFNEVLAVKIHSWQGLKIREDIP